MFNAFSSQFAETRLNLLNKRCHQPRKSHSKIGASLHHFAHEIALDNEGSAILEGLCAGRIRAVLSYCASRSVHVPGLDGSYISLFAIWAGLHQFDLPAGQHVQILCRVALEKEKFTFLN